MRRPIPYIVLLVCTAIPFSACVHIVGAYVTSGVSLDIEGYATDGATGEPLANAPVVLNVVRNGRTEVADRELARTGRDGHFDYENTVMWCRKMGPLEFNRMGPEEGTVSIRIEGAGYESRLFEYSINSVWETDGEPFPIHLGIVQMTAIRTAPESTATQ